MPYKEIFVQPDVFMTIKGHKIYHTYDDQQANDLLSNYFTFYNGTEEREAAEQGAQFDVRELSTWTPTNPPYLTGDNNTEANKQKWVEYHKGQDEVDIKTAIRLAYAKGELQQYIDIANNME